MAARIKRLSLLLRTFLMIIWAASGGDGYNCPYGQNCAFEPAPPGRAPPCAQPGLTYCIHPEPYPEHVIRKLVKAGQYDIRTLLSDESRDNFDAVKKDAYPYGYGPNSLPHVDQISLVDDGANYHKDYNNKFQTRYNQDIYSEKTPLQPPTSVEPTPYNIKAFQATNYSKFGFQGYHSSPSYWNPISDHDKGIKQNSVTPNLGIYNPNYFNPNFYQNYDSTNWLRQASSDVTQYNPSEWWKYITPSRTASDVSIQRSLSFPAHPLGHGRQRRNAELVEASARGPLTGAEALRIALGLASEDPSAERSRRQAVNSIDLCQTRTQFIQPQAAQNNKGNWRYVVNMPDNMTQLVRVETCMSSECSGLCSIPRGYTSRCEQKYIQKRLVALQPSGQTLYTDVFWIPSCCQCTIVNNNN